ncbi:MAG: FAD-dependent oxidoreductase, partial [Chloroflexi bacterium]|nr:FAD-dependent oxidoreductase [Chloroflexota bacterium]
MDLVDAGWQVTLLERRPFAGGRTFSFTNAQGDALDNGQHVFLGCCTAYLELLERLGQRDQAFLQDRLDVRVVDAELGPARLFEAPLPAPLHLLPAFVRFPYLNALEKARAAQALLEMRVRDLPESQTFAGWLRERRHSDNAIRRLWDLIIIPTCNAPSERVSARQAGFVFREGLLRTRWGGRIGYPRVGLSHIVPEAAVAYLRSRGASLRFGAAGARFDPPRGLVFTSGERLAADTYIVALPPDETSELLPAHWPKPALDSAPIVGVNLWYDRPLFEGEVLAVIVDVEAHWVFDRTRILGEATAGHHIAVSMSAAEAFMDVPREDIAARIHAKLARALPAARQATLLRSTVEKVRSATFVPSPGAAISRLPTRT